MFRFLASLSLPCVPLLAQATLLVGPGGYAQIQTALAAAAPGDIVLVQPGTYLPFTADVAVRILAPSGATVASTGQFPSLTATVLRPQVGGTVYVSGLTFAHGGSLYPHVVRVDRGQGVLENCSFPPNHPLSSLYAFECWHADAVLVHCTFSTINGGARVDGGSLSASDCAFHGVDPQVAWPDMPAAVEVRDSNVQLSFCTMNGADSYAPSQPGGPGMRVAGASRAALVDCTCTGGDAHAGSPPAASGLVNTTTQPVRHLRSSFLGGTSMMITPVGGWPVRGAGITGLEQASALVGLVGSTSGPRVGQFYGVAATAQPAVLVLYAASFGLQPPAPLPLLAQPIRIAAANAIPFGSGVTNGVGAHGMVVANSLPAAALGVPLWLHAFVSGGGVFECATPVGGVVR
jgi:hypothetical protein